MKVSIIIPVYKVEEYLRKCVDSVLDNIQYDNYEVILVDDGSPDNCGQLIDDYAKINKHIIPIHQSNQGLSAARNTGVKNATGDYLIFIDSDDYVDENLAQAVNLLNSIQSDVVEFGRVDHVLDECNKVVRKYTGQFNTANIKDIKYLAQPSSQYTSAWIKAVKRETFINNDLWFKNGRLCEDYDWSVRLWAGNYSYYISDICFYHYIVNRVGSIMNKFSYRTYQDMQKTAKENYALINSTQLPKKKKTILYKFLSYHIIAKLRYYTTFSKDDYNCCIDFLKSNKWIFHYSSTIKHKLFVFLCAICGVNNGIKLCNLIIK